MRQKQENKTAHETAVGENRVDWSKVGLCFIWSDSNLRCSTSIEMNDLHFTLGGKKFYLRCICTAKLKAEQCRIGN